MPWAYLVDVLIACLPMLDGNRIHGPMIAFVVYLIALVSLRTADNWAVRKNGAFQPGQFSRSGSCLL
jgi:hypothetical protein